jgi:hypothetical protein
MNTAIAKYGRAAGRLDGLLPDDIKYLEKVIDPKILAKFHYPPLPSNGEATKTTTQSTITKTVEPSYREVTTAAQSSTVKNVKPSNAAEPPKEVVTSTAQSLTKTKTEPSNEEVATTTQSLTTKKATTKIWDLMNSSECNKKTRLVELLLRAGKDVTLEDCRNLPTWREVVSLYGEEPVIHGLDTCKDYRAAISAERNNGRALKPQPRVAGLFNSGTNALAMTFNHNFGESAEDYKEYQIFSGKHAPVSKLWLSRRPEPNVMELFRRVMPVTLIRDPFRWMTSMVSQVGVLSSVCGNAYLTNLRAVQGILSRQLDQRY